MILVFLLLSFFVVVFCALLLINAGRTFPERIGIFFNTPRDSGRDEGLITIVRFIFWVSLIVSAWIVVKLCRGRGAF